MSKSFEIKIEVDRRFVIGGAAAEERSDLACGSCGRDVQMLSAEDAGLIAQQRLDSIISWAKEGRLHCGRTDEGRLLICSNSLGALIHEKRGEK